MTGLRIGREDRHFGLVGTVERIADASHSTRPPTEHGMGLGVDSRVAHTMTQLTAPPSEQIRSASLRAEIATVHGRIVSTGLGGRASNW